MKRIIPLMLAISMMFMTSCELLGQTDTSTEASDSITESQPESSESESQESSVSESESFDDSENTSESESESESETEAKQEMITPENGAVIILANDDVCGWWKDYYFKKTNYTEPFYLHQDIYYPKDVTFSWSADEDVDYYKFYISTDENFGMGKTESYLVNVPTITLSHLFTSSKYYWKVVGAKANADGTSEVSKAIVSSASFTTAESPRCLKVEGVSNTRDMGGWDAIDGMRVKQGMIYRGGKLEGITQEGKDFFLYDLNIVTDFDLRTPGEGGAGNGSPLGSGVNYINMDGRYYTGSKGITTEEGKKIFAEEIRVFTNPDNYPIYIHCSLGRDRTGTIVFVLQSLLGVSRNTMMMDYELSVFSVTGTQDNASVTAIKNNITGVYNYINENFEGDTYPQKTENYLLSIGITEQEIQAIKDIMLEEVE